MLSKNELKEKPFSQLILITGLCLVSVVVFSIIGVVASAVFYDLSTILDTSNPKAIEGLQFIQLLSSIGLFIVPPIIFGLIVSKKPFQYLGFKRVSTPISIGLVLMLTVVSMPFLSWIVELNANVVLPDFLSAIEQWMRAKETEAMELTQAFLTFNGIGSLFYILLIVAVIPGIGEELLFRGVLQPIFIKWTKNKHWGIWITAFLFSALHMQFFGFFPRMLLGVVFGYLFLWSGSLWLPILGHFVNNGTVVIASYIYQEPIDEMGEALFENGWINAVVALVSLGAVLYILKLFKKINVSVISTN